MAAPYGSTSLAGAHHAALPAAAALPLKRPAPQPTLDFVLALAALFIPCGVLTVNWYALAFTLRYRHSQLSWFIVELGFCLICLEGFFTFRAWRRRRTRDPTWCVFLCLSTALAWILGTTFGLVSYEKHMRQFYDMESLEMYVNIDPATDNGLRYMDAGRIVFTKTSYVDVSLAAGIEDGGMHCVAPVNSATRGVAYYDFWVVGMDCCAATGKNFHCADIPDGRPAHSAMRLMDAAALPAYRRAADKAAEMHKIHTRNPMFFTWVEDPLSAVNAHQDIGFMNFLFGTLSFFAFQLFCVTMIASGAVRLGPTAK